jgi:hypothetical protein
MAQHQLRRPWDEVAAATLDGMNATLDIYYYNYTRIKKLGFI